MVKTKEYLEGKTKFLSADLDYYSDNVKQPKSSLPVFYNPRMASNRDLSILFLDTFNQQYPIETFCEPLCGSGIRSLRYLNEGHGEYAGILNDINPKASEIANMNVEKLDLQNRARVLSDDARRVLLSESRETRFDYVDIDPFGSPASFINGAIQSLKSKNSLLAITATDMPVLCGVFPRVALRKYGGISIKAPFLHEVAVRLLIGSTYTVAGMNDCAIKPLAVLSTDHYVRIWVKVDAEKKTTNKQADNVGFIHYCSRCMRGWKQPILKSEKSNVCKSCGKKSKTAGPLWIGPLFDSKFMDDAQSTLSKGAYVFEKRSVKLFELMMEEKDMTDYLYVDIHKLCDMHDFPPPSTEDIMDAIREEGNDVSRTHFRPTAIRTNADLERIVEIIEELNRTRK